MEASKPLLPPSRLAHMARRLLQPSLLPPLATVFWGYDFSAPLERGELGSGLEYSRGYYQSLQPTQMGLFFNLDLPRPLLDHYRVKMCKLVDGERCTQKLIERQVCNMQRATCQRLQDRVKLQDHQSGRESRVTASPSMGKRNMSDNEMYNGVKLDFWVCLNFSRERSGTVGYFSTQLLNMCACKGMNVNMCPVRPARAFSPLKIEKSLGDVASLASKAKKQLQLMIVILPDHSESHGEIERICRKLGIIVQCFEVRNISISVTSLECLADVALEINSKVLTKYRSHASYSGSTSTI